MLFSILNLENPELVEKIYELIDSLNNYVSNLSNTNITIVEIWTIIIASFAALSSIISIVVTISGNKKNRKSSEEIAEKDRIEENKRAEAAIDANITANARIEWIQKVRQATADLITTCYKYINSEVNSRDLIWLDIIEKKTLFVLYFGPDTNVNELKIDVLNSTNNKGKNDQIVLFLDELLISINNYHANHSLIEVYDEDLSKCYECYSFDEDNCDFFFHPTCEKNEYGELFDEEDCNQVKTDLINKLKDVRDFENDMFKKLTKFSEIMRVYGKIEWNRAKEGI